MKKLFQVDTGYACGGVITEDDYVIHAAPIFRWMVGKPVSEVSKWRKIVKVTKASEYN